MANGATVATMRRWFALFLHGVMATLVLCAMVTPAKAEERDALPVVLPAMATVLEAMLGPEAGSQATVLRVKSIAIDRSTIRVTYTEPDAEALLQPPGSLSSADARTSKFDVKLIKVAAEARSQVLNTLTQRLDAGQQRFVWHSPPPREPIPEQAKPPVSVEPPPKALAQETPALLTPLAALSGAVLVMLLIAVFLAVRVQSLRKPMAIGLPAALVASLVIPVPRSDGNEARVDFDHELGWSPIHADDEWPTGPNPPKTWGQRPVTIDPKREHIVLLGDSVGHGWGLNDDQTIDHHLQQLLPEYQVINLSVTGWAPDQEYLYFLRALPQLRPKMVLMLAFIGNDVPGLQLASFYGHSKPLLRVQDGKLVRVNPTLRRLNCISILSQSLALHFFWAAGNAGPPADRETVSLVVDAVCQSPRTSRAEAAAVMSAIVSDAQTRSRKLGAEFVTVIMPTSAQRSPEPDVDPMEQIRADTGQSAQSWRDLLLLREVLQKGQHTSLEVHRWMQEDFALSAGGPQTAGKGPMQAKELFLDGGHLNAEASAWLAKRLAAWIRSRPATASPLGGTASPVP